MGLCWQSQNVFVQTEAVKCRYLYTFWFFQFHHSETKHQPSIKAKNFVRLINLPSYPFFLTTLSYASKITSFFLLFDTSKLHFYLLPLLFSLRNSKKIVMCLIFDKCCSLEAFSCCLQILSTHSIKSFAKSRTSYAK